MQSVLTSVNRCIVSFILGMGLLGCGSGNNLERIIVEGNVTLDGNPVKNGQIMFFPTKGTKGPVSGGPIKDGHYIAKASGGVIVGTHLVSIEAYVPKDPNQANNPEGGEVKNIIPPKFSGRTSTLERTVTSETPTLDFDLKTKE